MTRLGPSRRPVAGVAVIVPAHDEEANLARCLGSLGRALAHRALRGLATVIVVVLDDCRDRSGAVARRHVRAGDIVVEVATRNVGSARATGSAVALRHLSLRGLTPSSVWLSHTDADTTVPRHWLRQQLTLSARVDAVAGIVRVDDWSEHSAGTSQAFARRYGPPPSRGLDRWVHRHHPHVHGANLGLRGDAYLEAGEFPPVACAEDHAIWRGVNATGRPVLSTRRLWVTTSGRRNGRAPGGFAATLASLSPDPASGVVPCGGPPDI